MNFRLLRPEEVEVRVAQIGEKSVSLLLYTDARACMKLLDEAVGQFGWQREHQIIDGNLWCKVSVYDPDRGEWVGKMDVGTESMTEKEKGESSDSFKRACVNWGIGRELYTAPTIVISKETVKTVKRKRGDVEREYIQGDLFVSNIEYIDGAIDLLEITQNIGTETNIVYQRKHLTTIDGYPKVPEMIKTLQELFSDTREDVQKWLEKMYNVTSYGELTEAQLKVLYTKKVGEQKT